MDPTGNIGVFYIPGGNYGRGKSSVYKYIDVQPKSHHQLFDGQGPLTSLRVACAVYWQHRALVKEMRKLNGRGGKS